MARGKARAEGARGVGLGSGTAYIRFPLSFDSFRGGRVARARALYLYGRVARGAQRRRNGIWGFANFLGKAGEDFLEL